ncbi:restriction endonuclease subunit S [Sporosarcina sp. YIM B06819]|uniref:restriction endonuclease subunit S n=1 Tax=Sporosarcina sp. YIM B06819 TaxID=3081769 RepID=UPI00298C0A68|nr:restriction endonuclease subunit S [Sporosarcina sp. YIM B06819]
MATKQTILEKVIISSNDAPFEVPVNWVWCELGGISNFIDYRGKTPTKTDEGIKLITAKNVKNNQLNGEPEEFIAEEDYEKWMTRGIPKFGDILFTTEGPLGNVAQLNIEGKVALAQRIVTIQTKMNKEFLKYVLLSKSIQKVINSFATGTTVKGIKASNLKKIPIPIPPIKEQKRIVDSLDFSFCRISEVSGYLFKAKKFLEERHEALLKIAFRGELVNQDDSITNNFGLLNFIQEELMKEKKKKIEINPIAAEEQPYDIPESWVYLRIGDIIKITGGSQPTKSIFKYKYEEGYTRLVQIRDFKSNDYLTYVPNEYANRPFKEDDVMIGRYGPPVFQILRGLSGTYNVALMKAEVNPNIMTNDYLYYLLQEPRIQKAVIKDSARSSGQTGIRRELLESIVISIPPIEEQKKIVERLDIEFEKEKEIKFNIEQLEMQLKKMQESILQKSIRGELVEQRIEEGMGLDLLKEMIEKNL